MAKLTFADYRRLVKTGIIYGNSLHYIIGALIAVPLVWADAGRAAIGLIATMLLIASACMVNNWLDRKYDTRMERTAGRVTASSRVNARQIYTWASILGLVGAALLFVLVNPLTALLGVAAWVSYSIIYTLSKPHTAWSTIIGTVPGALPALAGYTAVSGEITSAGWWLFGLIVAWQLPHFYAISVYRRSDYRVAGVAVLSTRVSAPTMRVVIIICLLLYLAVAVGMAATTLGAVAGGVLVVAAAVWLLRSSVGTYDNQQHESWARGVFIWSMLVSIGMLLASMVYFAQIRFM